VSACTSTPSHFYAQRAPDLFTLCIVIPSGLAVLLANEISCSCSAVLTLKPFGPLPDSDLFYHFPQSLFQCRLYFFDNTPFFCNPYLLKSFFLLVFLLIANSRLLEDCLYIKLVFNPWNLGSSISLLTWLASWRLFSSSRDGLGSCDLIDGSAFLLLTVDFMAFGFFTCF